MINHNKIHSLFSCHGFLLWRPIEIASSNSSCNPFCVKEEHSIYFIALSSFAIRNPSAVVMGTTCSSFNKLSISLSTARSSLVATRMIGVFGE